MASIWYGYFNNGSRETFSFPQYAVAAGPELIIGLLSQGLHYFRFPERTVEQEHFKIEMLNTNGAPTSLSKRGWRLVELRHPLEYGHTLKMIIADPKGVCRVFSKQGHFQPIYIHQNVIEGIELAQQLFESIAESENWSEFERALLETPTELSDDLRRHVQLNPSK